MDRSISRRSILGGLIAAPIVITTPGLLMPVKAFTRYQVPIYNIRRIMPTVISGEILGGVTLIYPKISIAALRMRCYDHLVGLHGSEAAHKIIFDLDRAA